MKKKKRRTFAGVKNHPNYNTNDRIWFPLSILCDKHSVLSKITAKSLGGEVISWLFSTFCVPATPIDPYNAGKGTHTGAPFERVHNAVHEVPCNSDGEYRKNRASALTLWGRGGRTSGGWTEVSCPAGTPLCPLSPCPAPPSSRHRLRAQPSGCEGVLFWLHSNVEQTLGMKFVSSTVLEIL